MLCGNASMSMALSEMKMFVTLAENLGVSEIEIEGVDLLLSLLQAAAFRPAIPSTLIPVFCRSLPATGKIREAFEQATGAPLWGKWTPREPSVSLRRPVSACRIKSRRHLINLRPFTRLTPQKVHRIIQNLKAGIDLDSLADHPDTNIQSVPEDDRVIFFRPYVKGAAIQPTSKNCRRKKYSAELEKAKLHGMGGAFFPVHLKWQACRERTERQEVYHQQCRRRRAGYFQGSGSDANDARPDARRA